MGCNIGEFPVGEIKVLKVNWKLPSVAHPVIAGFKFWSHLQFSRSGRWGEAFYSVGPVSTNILGFVQIAVFVEHLGLSHANSEAVRFTRQHNMGPAVDFLGHKNTCDPKNRQQDDGSNPQATPAQNFPP